MFTVHIRIMFPFQEVIFPSPKIHKVLTSHWSMRNIFSWLRNKNNLIHLPPNLRRFQSLSKFSRKVETLSSSQKTMEYLCLPLCWEHTFYQLPPWTKPPVLPWDWMVGPGLSYLQEDRVPPTGGKTDCMVSWWPCIMLRVIQIISIQPQFTKSKLALKLT